jgi:protein-tyrosine-phosphatase/DNA-binding transcriptional ArsR family regulator
VESAESDLGAVSRDFLQLAGHPVRWRLLRELARSDRRVGELTGLLGQPQNLLSYHLGRLRAVGLVSARRSSADGRDFFYTAEVGRFADLLVTTGRSLHPGLRLDPAAPVLDGPSPGAPLARLLFLCTGNSARSQMAEAMAEERSDHRVRACSAGSHPKPLHLNAVRVMAERGIDLGARKPKHLSVFAAERFDYVITLCDKVREVCPEFPGHPGYIHWSIPDPAAGDGADDAYPSFRQVAADLDTRIGYLLAAIAASGREGQ